MNALNAKPNLTKDCFDRFLAAYRGESKNVLGNDAPAGGEGRIEY
jgi:hypothetical protein